MNSSRRVFISALNSQRNLSTSKGRSWSKSSPVHVTAILLGCVAFEFFYGAITESIWEGLNKGKLFQHYHMDRFKLEGQEDE